MDAGKWKAERRIIILGSLVVTTMMTRDPEARKENNGHRHPHCEGGCAPVPGPSAASVPQLPARDPAHLRPSSARDGLRGDHRAIVCSVSALQKRGCGQADRQRAAVRTRALVVGGGRTDTSASSAEQSPRSFTEAEDIANGDINFDDLDEPDEDSDSEADGEDELASSRASSLSGSEIHLRPIEVVDRAASNQRNGNSSSDPIGQHDTKGTPSATAPALAIATAVSSPGRGETLSEVSSPSTSLSTHPDFRQARLARPRSIRNSVRSSVRLSILALGQGSGDALQGMARFSSVMSEGSTESFVAGHDVLNISETWTDANASVVERVGVVADPTSFNNPPSTTTNLNRLTTVSSTESLSQPSPTEKYIPLIPTSPLQHQHTQILISYSRCISELERLNSATTTSNSEALKTLGLVRRLMETTTLLKTKLSSVASEISAASGKHVTDFMPRQLAVNLTLCDWDMFSSLITVQDLLQFSVRGKVTLPRSFRSCMDFSIFISRMVVCTILEAVPGDNGSGTGVVAASTPTGKPRSSIPTVGSSALASSSNRNVTSPPTISTSSITSPQEVAKTIAHWIQILPHLHDLQNYQSLHALIKALTHPAVKRLTRAWTLVPPKTRSILMRLEPVVSARGSDGGFAAYRAQAARATSPCVPLLGVFVDDLQARGATDFAQLQGQFERWRGTGLASVAYAGEAKERSGAVLHWVLSKGWVAEAAVWERSFVLEDEGGGQGSKLSVGGKNFLARLKGLGKRKEHGVEDDDEGAKGVEQEERDPNDHVYGASAGSPRLLGLPARNKVDLPSSRTEADDPEPPAKAIAADDKLDINTLRARLESLKKK
ncbi:hypothetical protein BC830DRAFT_659025 [Chytriomyces sp. MP71]|nr:hypothetical protein BC830DRAFT_659025 [Chytriomyces sp. MP71]